MREALAVVTGEGLPAMWERHARVQKHLWEGLSSMGLEPFVENPDERLLTVNTIKVRPWWPANCWLRTRQAESHCSIGGTWA